MSKHHCSQVLTPFARLDRIIKNHHKEAAPKTMIQTLFWMCIYLQFTNNRSRPNSSPIIKPSLRSLYTHHKEATPKTVARQPVFWICLFAVYQITHSNTTANQLSHHQQNRIIVYTPKRRNTQNSSKTAPLLDVRFFGLLNFTFNHHCSSVVTPSASLQRSLIYTKKTQHPKQ